jgi:hypothetical protein
MVSDGNGILPDKPAYHYVEKGHNGNHCHNGLSSSLANYQNMSGSSACVMFGEANGHSAFCAECAVVVRKLDLSSPIKS